jgi:hypothetical protein
VAGFATAGTAAAVPYDNGFLAQLETQGITYDLYQEARDDAELVCSRLFDGDSPNAIATDIHNQTDLTNVQAAFFVVASVTYYCGDFSESLTGHIG